MKVVLDTNVIIAAFIARGVCSELLEHCVQNHRLVVSEFLLAEVREHLTGKFRFGTEEVDQVLALIETAMELVIPADLPQRVCRDADDDAVLATAIAGGARCIVTGDQDLLVLREFRGIRIIRPADFAAFETPGV